MRQRNRIAWRTAALYASISAVWIFLSDQVVAMLIDGAHLRSIVQTGKGWAFVAATTVMLYGFVAAEVRELERTRAEAARHETELRAADEARRVLHSSLVTAQEDERRRIAEDIHDDPVQALTTLGLRLSLLGRSAADADLARALEELEDDIVRTTKRLRGLMVELQPPDLERDGLALTLRRHLERTFGGQLTTRLHDRLDAPLAPPIATTAYRIALEALTNVRKHASAMSVDVSLAPHEGGLLLTVADDGIGFDPGAMVPEEHIGLKAMRDRAAAAGGWWCVEPRADGGSEVRCWLPLTDEPAGVASPSRVAAANHLADARSDVIPTERASAPER